MHKKMFQSKTLFQKVISQSPKYLSNKIHPQLNPFVTRGTYIPLTKSLFKSVGITVSNFFSMLPSTLQYLYSVEPVRLHFPAKQPYCTNDSVCNAAMAQTISYEVRLAFTLLSFVVLVCRYNLVFFIFLFFSILFVVNFSFSSFVIYLIYFLFGWN